MLSCGSRLRAGGAGKATAGEEREGPAYPQGARGMSMGSGEALDLALIFCAVRVSKMLMVCSGVLHLLLKQGHR